MTEATAAATAYVVIAALCCVGLARRWRGIENGLNPGYVAALWLPVAMGLVLYYAAALAYTLAVIVRGRRATTGVEARGRGAQRAVDAR